MNTPPPIRQLGFQSTYRAPSQRIPGHARFLRGWVEIGEGFKFYLCVLRVLCG
jgi:hypothetical protein